VILDFLRSMGAKVRTAGNSVIVSQARLKAIRADLSNCIDLLPTMAVLAALADGVSEFTGIERARLKESNRLAAVKEGLGRMGVTVTGDKYRLTITGLMTKKPVTDIEAGGESKIAEEGPAPATAGPTPEGIVIDSRSDHRIAMAFGILGTAIGGVTISEAECVAKTFPQFWDTLKGIGGQLEEHS
jgi:3-phosphoshikimate 1-carboxyvinyltransferase